MSQHSIALIDPNSTQGTIILSAVYLSSRGQNRRSMNSGFLQGGIMMMLFWRLSDHCLAVRSQTNVSVMGSYRCGLKLFVFAQVSVSVCLV